MRTRISLYNNLYHIKEIYNIYHYQTTYKYDIPASILYKSIAGRYRPVSYPDGPITARYRFIKNAYWDLNLVKWTLQNENRRDMTDNRNRSQRATYESSQERTRKKKCNERKKQQLEMSSMPINKE